MLYNEELYLFVFLPIVLLIYQIVPKKARWIVLLLTSYAFFITNSEKEWVIVFLIGTNFYTYFITGWINKLQNKLADKTSGMKAKEAKEAKEIKNEYKKKTKKILILGISGLIISLLYLHYVGFFTANIDKVLKMFNSSVKTSDIISKPVFVVMGVSFYTLEAIGYMTDVYWGKVKMEKNPFKLGLFLNFFPQLLQGPIALHSQTAGQLVEGKSLTVANLKKGYIRIFWGLLKLFLVSVRLTPIVKQLFDNWEMYSGAEIIFAAIAYTTMLYMDFSGGIDICIGSAQLFGIELPENFRQPFSAKSASEFWQRWHISLGVWFKTYIFYPASVSKIVKKWNKFAKKKLNKYIAKVGVSAICLFPVWMCNGLWHGPRATYIFYGIYYFVILLLEVALEPVRNGILKLTRLKEDGCIWRFLLSVKTLTIIFVGELFFNAKTLPAGFKMFASIFRKFNLAGIFDINFLTKLGTKKIIADKADYISIAIGIIVVAIYGALKQRGKIDYEKIDSMKTPYKWAIYYALIILVLLLGAYGDGYDSVALIYANF